MVCASGIDPKVKCKVTKPFECTFSPKNPMSSSGKSVGQHCKDSACQMLLERLCLPSCLHQWIPFLLPCLPWLPKLPWDHHELRWFHSYWKLWTWFLGNLVPFVWLGTFDEICSILPSSAFSLLTSWFLYRQIPSKWHEWSWLLHCQVDYPVLGGRISILYSHLCWFSPL